MAVFFYITGKCELSCYIKLSEGCTRHFTAKLITTPSGKKVLDFGENIASFFRKWMQDMTDGKMKNDVVPAVVPYAAMDLMYTQTGGSAGWADAAVLLPYRFWKRYGDSRVMKEYYQKISRPYGMFLLKNTGHADKKTAKQNSFNEFVYEKGRHLGEWLEPEEFNDKIGPGSQLKQTEVATAYFHYSMTLLSEMAEALGEKDDAVIFCKNADGSKRAYQELFLKEGAPDTDRQAKLVRPLALGWLYEVNRGATTIWEDWEGTVSHNHDSPGGVWQWLFETVAGIRVDGENHFIIAPRPGGTLTEAEASYHSIYGKVESSWKGEEDGIAFCITIPPNTSAEIILPDGTRQKVEKGVYSYLIKNF